jgi:hypothetical protein
VGAQPVVRTHGSRDTAEVAVAKLEAGSGCDRNEFLAADLSTRAGVRWLV